MEDKTYQIISFSAQTTRYGPISLGSDWLTPHTEIKIPLGHSRFGGPVVDLPPGIEHPAGLRFVAQLDLGTFAPHDPTRLLPTSGQLFVFADIESDTGTVIYSKVSNDQLQRNIFEHDDNFFEGVLIDRVYSDTESLSERYREPEDEEEIEFVNQYGKVWDPFAGSERSKMFGVFTHCQWDEEWILDLMDSEKIVLLQVGENGFNDEGVFSVLVNKNDLKNKQFDKCIFHWSQS